MARKAGTPPPPPSPPKLLISVNEARERLLSRREQGASLLQTQSNSIRGEQGLEEAEAAFSKWHEYNREMLRRIFDTEEYANYYSSVGVGAISLISIGYRDVGKEIRDHLDYFKAKIDYLESLADRLDLIEVSHVVRLSQPAVQPDPPREKSSRKVFLVHGRDNETKTIVARFIEHCGLDPVILHEQADQGRTIIEKFEQNSDVAFAVVLLTPDDLGGIRPAGEVYDLLGANFRARQNVILELGYFIGKLGRSNVCALKKGEVELPSDFSGVVYTPYDGADEGWKIKLAREMRTAGLAVDLNRALG